MIRAVGMTEEHNLVKPANLIAQDAEEADEIEEALGGDGDPITSRQGEMAKSSASTCSRSMPPANSRFMWA